MRQLTPGLAVLISACAQPVAVVDETSIAPLPEASYAAALKSGAAVYRIEPLESLLLVRVGRAGTMKRLGHDHVIASEHVQGLVEINSDPTASRADVVVPVRNLIVDKPSYRDRLGLETTPSDADIAGTYTNMLKVLEPSLYPWVVARARIASVNNEAPTLVVSMTVNGTTVEYLMPVRLVIDRAKLAVDGRAVIRHSEFGLIPYQAAGGLLRVADELEIDFRLVAIAMPRS